MLHTWDGCTWRKDAQGLGLVVIPTFSNSLSLSLTDSFSFFRSFLVQNLNSERLDLIERARELRQKRTDHAMLRSKGLDFIVAIERGEAPPTHFILSNMRGKGASFLSLFLLSLSLSLSLFLLLKTYLCLPCFLQHTLGLLV